MRPSFAWQAADGGWALMMEPGSCRGAREVLGKEGFRDVRWAQLPNRWDDAPFNEWHGSLGCIIIGC